MGDHQTARRRWRAINSVGLRRAFALAGLFLAVGAVPASAENLRLTFTDPVDQADPALDLVAGEVQQDPVTGSITARIELAGPQQPTTAGSLLIAMGTQAPNGDCVTQSGVEFVTLMDLTSQSVTWTVGLRYGEWSPGTGAITGNVAELAVTSDGRLRSRIGTCAAVSIGYTPVGKTSAQTVETANAVAELKPTVVGGQVATSPTGDRDLDGISDIVDRCPTEAGLQADGCPAAPGGKSLRLGARRLVVVRLMAKVNGVGNCPSLVKVVVSQNRRLGAANLPVTAQKNLCEVKGVVRLRRYRKGATVRVVLTGNGLSTVIQRIAT